YCVAAGTPRAPSTQYRRLKYANVAMTTADNLFHAQKTLFMSQLLLRKMSRPITAGNTIAVSLDKTLRRKNVTAHPVWPRRKNSHAHRKKHAPSSSLRPTMVVTASVWTGCTR